MLVCAGQDFTASKGCRFKVWTSSQVFHGWGPPWSSLNVSQHVRAWLQKITVHNMEDPVLQNCMDTAEQTEGKRAVILACWAEMQVKWPLWIGHAALQSLHTQEKDTIKSWKIRCEESLLSLRPHKIWSSSSGIHRDLTTSVMSGSEMSLCKEFCLWESPFRTAVTLSPWRRDSSCQSDEAKCEATCNMLKEF